MGLALQVILFAIAVALVVQRSAGSNIFPSPTIFTEIPPIEGSPGISTHANAPSPISLKDGSVSHLPPVLSPVKSAPGPQTTNRTTASAPDYSAPPPFISHGIALSPPPSASPSEEPISNTPISVPLAPVPVALPSTSSSPQKPPSFQPIMPGSVPPISNESIAPNSKAPQSMPNDPEPDVSPLSTPPPSINGKRDGIPVAAPTNVTSDQFSPPEKAPSIHKASRHRNYIAPLTSPESPPVIWSRSPASLPSASFNRHHDVKKNITSPLPSSLLLPPHHPSLRGPMISPAHSYPSKLHANSRQRRYAAPPMNSVSPSRSPFSSSKSNVSPASSPSPTAPPGQTKLPFLSPKISPLGPSPRYPKPSLLRPIHALPPPPPNEDCLSLICREPFTNTPPGSSCGCVWPMQVGLRLSVALYTFFPLVSELAEEIALGVFMRQRQVRIMGANAASQDPEKTIILIDLVPLGEKFDNTTAYLTSERFWNKQVAIKTSLFGNYEVLYVRYPGLPPSPPSGINVIDGEPYSGHDNNGQPMKPLGVDVRRVQHKNGLNGSVIAIIVLSASVAAILCCAVAWILLFKQRHYQQESTSLATQPSLSKPSGIAASIFGSGPTPASLSFGSNIATYTGSAKTFTLSDMEKATDNFSSLRILGEGGFGRVYSGVLEDGTKVAVKVLKRDDQQGGREFLAEVEMLSRLHHRNLVKLIGICTEVRARCLVYELIPNGSVESHLHGNDKEAAPLDWGARTKIALGAARGLAYLHEDSSPRVIHRDFKSSNILLEHDFTPKVSDFGLARTALDEENGHISTRVMGTFGYVAPEYAMTGHLLVKSDVYSYGVVLLELLTGRKPVDMSQPPGQENLVAWARPLLTNQEDLESIIDPSLGPNFTFNSIAKVSAIASMCVQPEVSHRPFMGEVVQALKLVCDECDVEKEMGSRSSSREDLLINIDPLDAHSPISNYDSAPDVESGFLVSVSDLFRFEKLEKQVSRSFRRHSSSGPLTFGRGKRIWQKLRRLSGGTVSEHGTKFRFSSESH